MPRAAVLLVSLIALVLGWAVGRRAGPREPAVAADTAVVDVSAEALATRCQAETGFDPDVTHWSGEYEVAQGIRVVIVPHLQSNKHNPGQLARGQVIAKFVNQSQQNYLPLALPGGGESCLFVQSARRPNADRDQLTARLIAAGNAAMERTIRSFRIELHDTLHSTPRAHWYNAVGQIIARDGALPGFGAGAAFRLASFPLQGDSAGGGPSAWVTCVTNGCCRFSLEE